MLKRIRTAAWVVVESFNLECMRVPLFVGGA